MDEILDETVLGENQIDESDLDSALPKEKPINELYEVYHAITELIRKSRQEYA